MNGLKLIFTVVLIAVNAFFVIAEYALVRSRRARLEVMQEEGARGAALALTQLELTPRGGWRAQLEAGTTLELGSGSTAELVARTERFLKTVTQATAHYNRSVEQLASVDLRHGDGYAIRLNGVSTVEAADMKKVIK